jgi:hypothetical protein
VSARQGKLSSGISSGLRAIEEIQIRADEPHLIEELWPRIFLFTM